MEVRITEQALATAASVSFGVLLGYRTLSTSKGAIVVAHVAATPEEDGFGGLTMAASELNDVLPAGVYVLGALVPEPTNVRGDGENLMDLSLCCCLSDTTNSFVVVAANGKGDAYDGHIGRKAAALRTAPVIAVTIGNDAQLLRVDCTLLPPPTAAGRGGALKADQRAVSDVGAWAEAFGASAVVQSAAGGGFVDSASFPRAQNLCSLRKECGRSLTCTVTVAPLQGVTVAGTDARVAATSGVVSVVYLPTVSPFDTESVAAHWQLDFIRYARAASSTTFTKWAADVKNGNGTTLRLPQRVQFSAAGSPWHWVAAVDATLSAAKAWKEVKDIAAGVLGATVAAQDVITASVRDAALAGGKPSADSARKSPQPSPAASPEKGQQQQQADGGLPLEKILFGAFALCGVVIAYLLASR